MKVCNFSEDLQEISNKALQEHNLKNELKKLEEKWNDTIFKFKPFKDRPDTLVLAGMDEFLANLDEGMATVGNILASRYVTPLREAA